MNRFKVLYSLIAAALTIAATTIPTTAVAGCGQTTTCCPACKYECKLKAEEIEVEKSCFEVETKAICIPKVVFPWQRKSACNSCGSCDGRGCNNCVQNGACVKTIKVLKSKKYKCPECEYTWSAEKKSCDNGCTGVCDAGCDSNYNGSMLEMVGNSATPSQSSVTQEYSRKGTPDMESVQVERSANPNATAPATSEILPPPVK